MNIRSYLIQLSVRLAFLPLVLTAQEPAEPPAIAAEPAAIRIPRERPAPVVLDDAPLILVETRKDLADLRLPFETHNTAS